MANVHRLGDRSEGRSRSDRGGRGDRPRREREEDGGEHQGGFLRLGEPVLEEQIRVAEEKKIIFISGRRQVKDPKDQNYWDMLYTSFCPQFSLLSITSLLILVDLVMYIVELALGFDKTAGNLLQVNTDTLMQLGANFEPDVKKGQVYRLLAALVLHSDFIHFFSNVFSTFLVVSRLQHTFGPIKTLIVYVASGILGNIFRDTIVTNTPSVGASTALYGVIGVIIGYIIINWSGFDLVGPILKCQLMCSTIFLFIWILVFTPTSALDGGVDFLGHLGGFIAGLFLACIHSTILTTNRQTIVRILFAILLAIMALTCFLLVFLR